MSEYEGTIIPLDDAHAILSAFGIGPYSRTYQRWRREDGFRWVDLEAVLNESPAILGVDWRSWLQDEIETILGQLQAIGIPATAVLSEDGQQGFLKAGTKKAKVKYVIDDEDNFDDVMESVNWLIRPAAFYRKFQSCEGSDGWGYALLKAEEWNELDSVAPATVALLFKEVESV